MSLALPKGTIYDGKNGGKDWFSPYLCKQWTEIDKETDCHSRFFKFWQRSIEYETARANNGGPKLSDLAPDGSGAFFVGASPPRDIGGGIFEWEQEYIDVPPSKTVPVSYSYGYQAIVSGTDIAEITRTVSARITWDYFHIPRLSSAFPSASDTINAFLTGDATAGGSSAANAIAFFLSGVASGVPLLQEAYRIKKVGNIIYFSGVAPGIGDTYWLGEDQTLEAFRGNIFRRRTLIVPALTLTSL